MPQLPSGRHIAIHLSLLDDLLKAADEPCNVHRIMVLTTIEDLAPYVSICYLEPKSSAINQSSEQEFQNDALPRPPEMVVVESGFSLAQFDELSVDWSHEDIAAFQEFLEVRCHELFERGLKETELVRQWLINESGGLLRMLALWHKAGVHPCQEEGWAESKQLSTDWDTYDMLAALGQLAEILPKHPEKVVHLGCAHDRLQGVWQALRANYPIPPGWPEVDVNVRGCAENARSTEWLKNLPADKQKWLHDQCVIECVNLWNAYGESFMKDFPRQYGIVELVSLSTTADACFEKRG